MLNLIIIFAAVFGGRLRWLAKQWVSADGSTSHQDDVNRVYLLGDQYYRLPHLSFHDKECHAIRTLVSTLRYVPSAGCYVYAENVFFSCLPSSSLLNVCETEFRRCPLK
jgi:hypothetical protein